MKMFHKLSSLLSSWNMRVLSKHESSEEKKRTKDNKKKHNKRGRSDLKF